MKPVWLWGRMARGPLWAALAAAVALGGAGLARADEVDRELDFATALARFGLPYYGSRVIERLLVAHPDAAERAKPVKAELEGCRTISLVGGLSLRATARAISGCDFYIGADGGLAHCANALKLPGVVIFGNRVTPEVALCPNTSIKTLRNPRGVNHLPPRAVAEKIWAEWERWHG